MADTAREENEISPEIGVPESKTNAQRLSARIAADAVVGKGGSDDDERHSARSDDTVWEEAEGKEEDDLVEDTVGESKEKTLYIKMEQFITKQFGKKGVRKIVYMDEVEQHNTMEDFWCILDNKVFDLGPFLRGEAKHPGGKSILSRQLSLGGQDANERFVRWHHPSGNTVRRAPDYFVGDLGDPLRSKSSLPQTASKCCCTLS